MPIRRREERTDGPLVPRVGCISTILGGDVAGRRVRGVRGAQLVPTWAWESVVARTATVLRERGTQAAARAGAAAGHREERCLAHVSLSRPGARIYLRSRTQEQSRRVVDRI